MKKPREGPTPLRICLVGCGGFAQLCHGPALQRYAARKAPLSFVGCCDPDAGRAAAYCARFGYARTFSNPEVMIAAERPDAVVVAVPPEAAAAVAGPLLEAGVPMLLEKPPGRNPQELEGLMVAAGRGGVRVQVGFNRRYMPVMRRAAEIIAQRFAEVPPRRIDYELIRHERWDADFSTTAVHAIDALLFLAASPVVAAKMAYRENRSKGRSALDVELEAESAAGTRLTLRVLPVAGAIRETAAVHGVGRSLWLRLPASAIAPEVGSLAWDGGGRTVREFPDRKADPVVRLGIYGELEAFLDRVRTRADVYPSLADCRQQVAMMDAIRRRLPGVPGLPSTHV